MKKNQPALRFSPHNLNKHWWWYENRTSVEIFFNDGKYEAYTKIPVRSLRGFIKRLDAMLQANQKVQ